MDFLYRLFKEIFSPRQRDLPIPTPKPPGVTPFKNPFPVRDQRSPRCKTGEGPVERANRVGSPAWHAWQNEKWMIRTRHHSHPHLWREAGG